MRRRDFITLIGSATPAWPLAARAQQRLPVIGFLHSGSPEPNAKRVAAFRKGLGETGYVEGQNVAIEFRWVNDQDDRLAELAADLVHSRVAVIATPGSTQAAVAAKAATATIPIVFYMGADPVALGLVASLSRPGGNVTGISNQDAELMAKRLALLRELAPQAVRRVVLVNRTSPLSEAVIKNLQASVATVGPQVEILNASTGREIDAAFANLSQKPGGALLVSPDALFFNRRAQILTLAARHALPTIYYDREFVDAGGLMSYGADRVITFQQAGIYTGRILKGEKPADLPIMQPTKFELVINLNTARALDIEPSSTLLALADEVIE